MTWIKEYTDYLEENLVDVTKKQTFTFLRREYTLAFDELTVVLDSPEADHPQEALGQIKSAIRALAKLDFIGQAISQCARQEGEDAARIGHSLQQRIN